MNAHFRKPALPVILLASTVLFAGCATQGKPPPSISLDEPVQAQPLPEAPKPVEVVSVPEPLALPGQLMPLSGTGDAKLAQEPADEKVRVSRANAEARIAPTREGYVNAIQVWPFTDGALYQVYAAVGRVTVVALQPGEVLAVIGPSGAGKTSLGRVLLGLWQTSAGKVRLDGVDIHQWSKDELGPQLGYLPQGVSLIDGSLADNIARFSVPDPDRLQAAIEAAGLHELVVSLPDGLDTPLGPGGARLSGGQRQRIGLARAIYGQPAFVVLDEPNSSLDEAGDQALTQLIDSRRRRGTTFVVMTHRTSILSVADKILLLVDGQQQAFGPRDEVLAAIRQANEQHSRQATA